LMHLLYHALFLSASFLTNLSHAGMGQSTPPAFICSF
jgi:hypothetical protein